MAKKERSFRYIPPRIDRPRIEGPRFEGLRLRGPKFHGPKLHGPRVELTRHGKRKAVLLAGTALAVVAIAGKISGGGTDTKPGVSTETTPGTSVSASGNPVPEVFRVGSHTLRFDSGNGRSGGEMVGGGVIFQRVSDRPATYAVDYQPGFPRFVDGIWTKDPYIRRVSCKLENSGLQATQNPVLICKPMNHGPERTPFGKHGTAKK